MDFENRIEPTFNKRNAEPATHSDSEPSSAFLEIGSSDSLAPSKLNAKDAHPHFEYEGGKQIPLLIPLLVVLAATLTGAFLKTGGDFGRLPAVVSSLISYPVVLIEIVVVPFLSTILLPTLAVIALLRKFDGIQSFNNLLRSIQSQIIVQLPHGFCGEKLDLDEK